MNESMCPYELQPIGGKYRIIETEGWHNIILDLDLPLETYEEIFRALRIAYNDGYELGKDVGYDQGFEQGWEAKREDDIL